MDNWLELALRQSSSAYCGKRAQKSERTHLSGWDKSLRCLLKTSSKRWEGRRREIELMTKRTLLEKRSRMEAMWSMDTEETRSRSTSSAKDVKESKTSLKCWVKVHVIIVFFCREFVCIFYVFYNANDCFLNMKNTIKFTMEKGKTYALELKNFPWNWKFH